MKKAIALLATLVVLTGTTFAQLVPTITGSAETKWGVNLDDERNGFETDASVTVTIPLAAGEAATEGEGATGVAAITGTTITLDLNLTTDDGDYTWGSVDDDQGELIGTGALGDISAKIDFANGAYATIGGHTDIEANLVTGPRDFLDVNGQYGDEAGMSVGFAKDAYSVEFSIANRSEDAGFTPTGADDAHGEVLATLTDIVKEDAEVVEEIDETESPATDDGYIMGGKAMYTAGDIFTLDVAFATDSAANNLTAVKTSVSAKVASTPMEGLTITVPVDYLTLANDKDNGDNTAVAMEVMPAVDYAAGAVTAGVSFHYITLDYDIEGMDAYAGTRLAVKGGYTLDAGTVALELGSALGEADVVMTTADSMPMWNNDADVDTDLTVLASFKAADYSVTADLGDVINADGMDDLGIDATFTGVKGVSVSLETTLSLDDSRDNTEAFTLDVFNVNFSEAITGLENTVLTVNFSDFDGSDENKGTFYVGAKISL